MENIIVTVIVSLVSSSASFVMGGIWWLVKTQKKQAADLNAAFIKLRQLEGDLYASDEQAFHDSTNEANDGNVSLKDGSPLPESTSR